MQTSRRVLYVAAGLIAAGAALHAQQGRGTIFGTVLDPTGAAVAGARIEIRHLETNTLVSTTTTTAGLYAAPRLAVGGYTVSVEMSGFKKITRSGISLRVDDRAQVDFRLELGAVAESLVVQGEATLVDTGSATVGKVIDNTRMVSLPMNGRNALALVVLTPSVRSHAVSPQGFADRSVAVSSFSVNGGPPGNNNITIDGTSNINPRLGDASVNPGVDSVQEFKVQSGVMSAEYGYTAGGVVNMVTKSGTNEYHGSLYHFVRNDRFDARNAFAVARPPFRYNQYGGSVGGPIRRDRSFFFFNFEEWKLRRYYTVISTVPTEAERRGDFSQLRDANGVSIPVYDPNTTRANPAGTGLIRDPFAGNTLPATRLDRVAQNVLPFYPLPNRVPLNVFSNANNYQNNLGERRDARQITAKLDHRFTDKNSLSFRYLLWNHQDDNAGLGTGIFTDLVARSRDDDYTNRNFSLTDTHTFTPTLLNELRFGVVRQYFPFQGASTGLGYGQKLGLPASVPDVTLPSINIAGYQTFPSGVAAMKGLIGLDTFQLVDNVTWIHGSHTLKAGAELRRNRYNIDICGTCSGLFAFNQNVSRDPQRAAGTGSGLASFLLGAVASASGEVNIGTSIHGFSQAWYVQDDWRLTKRLTLNLGLRYDYQQIPVERFNGFSNFNPFSRNPDNGLLGRMEYAGVDYGRTTVQPDRNDFSPRIGFALDLQGNAKTVLRGGYGLYYPLTYMLDFFESSSGFSTNTTAYQPPGGDTNLPVFRLQDGFPSPLVLPLGSRLGPSAFQSQSVSYTQANGRTPYSQQFTLNVQRSLPSGWVIEIGYSGNKGTKLMASGWNLNQLDPQYLSLGRSLQERVANPYQGRVSGPLGGATVTRQQSLLPWPYQAGISVTSPRMGGSTYHSLLMSAEKRMSHGFVLLASFTFGKLLSDSIKAHTFAVGPREQVNVGNSYQNGKYDRRSERAIDPTDSAKRLVLSGVWEVPLGRKKLWGGWQFNGVATMQDGLPLVIRGANNFLAERPNSTGVSARVDNPTRQRWFDTEQFVNPAEYTFGNVGRTLPDVRGPGIVNIDFSLLKKTRLTERFNLQFRAEAFNATNRVNLFLPNMSFSPGPDGKNRSATFGVVTSSRDARILQLGLKLVF